jgi:hypothetical protein
MSDEELRRAAEAAYWGWQQNVPNLGKRMEALYAALAARSEPAEDDELLDGLEPDADGLLTPHHEPEWTYRPGQHRFPKRAGARSEPRGAGPATISAADMQDHIERTGYHDCQRYQSEPRGEGLREAQYVPATAAGRALVRALRDDDGVIAPTSFVDSVIAWITHIEREAALAAAPPAEGLHCPGCINNEGPDAVEIGYECSGLAATPPAPALDVDP